VRLKYNTGPLGRGLTCVERRPSRNDNNGCSRPRRAATRAHGGHTLHPRRHPSREQGTLHMPGDQHRLLGLFLFAGVWSLLSLVGLLDGHEGVDLPHVRVRIRARIRARARARARARVKARVKAGVRVRARARVKARVRVRVRVDKASTWPTYTSKGLSAFMTTPRRDMPSTMISSGAPRRTCLTSSVLDASCGSESQYS
jgi:hypothetical protein